MIPPIHQVIKAIDQPYRPTKPIIKVKTASAPSNFADYLNEAIAKLK